jgi:hypothetical protein
LQVECFGQHDVLEVFFVLGVDGVFEDVVGIEGESQLDLFGYLFLEVLLAVRLVELVLSVGVEHQEVEGELLVASRGRSV